jgi:hypothetical protein
MNMDRVFALAGSIVAVAMVSLFVLNPESANVIRAMGQAFSDSLKAATGRG